MSDLQYRRAGASENPAAVVDLVLHNHLAPFDGAPLRDWRDASQGHGFTLLDVRGEFTDPEALRAVLDAHPSARVFLPHRRPGLAPALDLFFAEDRASYVAVAPAPCRPGALDLEALVDRLEREENTVALFARVLDGDREAEVHEVPEPAGRRWELRRMKSRGGLVASPWMAAGIYDRNAWRDVGGMGEDFDDPRLSGLDLFWRFLAAGFEARIDADLTVLRPAEEDGTERGDSDPVTPRDRLRLETKLHLDDAVPWLAGAAERLAHFDAGEAFALWRLGRTRPARRRERRRSDAEILTRWFP